MKKQVKSFILGVVFTSILLCGFSVFGASITKKIDVLLNTLTVKVNSQIINSDNIIYGGNSYVRADKIANALNKNFTWDKKKNVISFTDKNLSASITTQVSNNKPVTNINDMISFTNVVTKSSIGTTEVYGEARNNDAKQHSFTLKVSFYDKNKKLLGTADGTVNNINGGETKIFTAMGMDDYTNADSYKVQVDTMINSEDNVSIPIKFSNVIVKSDLGMSTIEGETTNKDSKVHSFTMLIGIYDNTGKLLGVADGSVNDLQAGDTKTFTALTTDNLPDNVNLKVQIDTLVQ